MKILVLIDSFGRGGAENSTASFILGLKNQYQHFNFLCVYLDEYELGSYDQLQKNGIQLKQLEKSTYLGRIKEFRTIISQFKPDIVHSILLKSNLIARLAVLGTGKKYVESLVNKSYSSKREYLNLKARVGSKVMKTLDRWSSMGVDHFHSVGYAVANHYEKNFKRKLKFTVVERGRKVPELPETKSSQNEKLTFVTLARHEYQKGLIYLLEAAIPFRNKIEIKIYGRKGTTTEILEDFILKNQLENTIKFCGYIKNVLPELQKGDVYLSASLYEGLPGSVIEAMSVRKPLLLSRIEEHEEVAEENENAIFFEPKNSDNLSEKIEVFLKNKEMITAFGERSFEIFNQKFTEEIMVAGMAGFYNKLIQNETKRGSL